MFYMHGTKRSISGLFLVERENERLRTTGGYFMQKTVILVLIKLPSIGICALLGLMLAAPVFAQNTDSTERFSLGLGFEGNDYTDGEALGYGLSILGEYHFNPLLSAGLRVGTSYDFDELVTIEPLAFFRIGYTFRNRMHLFVEGDIGAALLLYESGFYPAFSGGLSGGIRVILKNWYIEPYVRGGYPVKVGGGLLFGYTW
jgi:hypothetical protein